jgi:hypothetical protein
MHTPVLQAAERQSKMNKIFSRWFVGVAALVSATLAWADPPSRVGRLVVYGGEVMVAHAGGEWRTVSQNYPITDGDNVSVGLNGRAEVDFGSGLAWLSGGTTVYFEQLDDQHFRTRMSDGQMIVRLRELDRGETARIDTRNGSVALTTPGLYRVETGETNNSRGDLVHVKFGNAEISNGNNATSLRAGDASEFGRGRMNYLNIRGDDAFGVWVDERDRRYESQRFAYVSPNMVGWRDLDEHGMWREVSTYGWVWFPRRVASDWAPYRFGHWTFVAPWGWTWVDDAPWGFAPFHYGRWVNFNGRWAWTPGPFERRPVYSPALVAWQGNVGGVSLQVGVNNPSLVYWTPLSWGEAYYPSYAVSANHWRLLNKPYVHHSAAYSVEPPRGTVYRNWNVRNGATAVEAAVIASARAVAPAARAMGPLPTTSQVEAYPIADRIKPAYGGAPTNYGNPATQYQQPARVMAPQAPVMVNEAATRAVPVAPASVQQQGYVQPGPQRSQPLPPLAPQQPQQVVPQVREQGIVTQPSPMQQPVVQQPMQQPVQQPQIVREAPPQNTAPRANPGPMAPPSRVMAPSGQPGMVAPQPLPQNSQADTRRVVPAQGPGEAAVPRVEQPYVDPIPRAPRVMPQMPARVQPVQPAPQAMQPVDKARSAPVEEAVQDKPKR